MNLSNKDNIEKLIKACAKGDRKGQKILYEAYYSKMLSVCVRYSSDINEAQDLLHDGFIKVFESIKGFKSKGSLEGWIRRIIVNNAIDYVRSRKIFYVENNDYIFNATEDKINELHDKEISDIKAQILIDMLQKLSPAYRTVFNLYIIEDYSHKEIAEALNINIGTSKSNLAKAKMKLREFYFEYIKNKDIE